MLSTGRWGVRSSSAACWWVMSVLLAVALWVIPDTRSVKATDTIPDPAPGCFIYALSSPCVELPEDMARDAYGVILCESNFREDVVNSSGHTGLLQISPVHRARMESMGYQWSDLLRGDVNLAVGTAIWREQGWRPWSCSP